MSSTLFQLGTVYQPDWGNQVDSASFAYLAAVTGTNTITAQGPQSYTAYTQQAGFILVPQNTNTGAVTLNINSLGAKAITKYGSTPLVTGDLIVGVVAYVVYDGTRFQLLNPQTVSARITGRLLGVQVLSGAGTYTPTAGTTTIVGEFFGAGGGGGGAASTGAGQSSVGAGGAGGGYAKVRITTGFSGLAFSCGTGGAGGIGGASGSTGGATTFGTISIGGGAGGSFVPAGTGTQFANGANNSGTNTIPIGVVIHSTRGENGLNGFYAAPVVGGSGAGGSCGVNSGGGLVYSANGQVGNGPGAGGSGAHRPENAAASNGGAGAAGGIIIWEYS